MKNLYDINGNLIEWQTNQPLSASPRNVLREDSDFNMDKFDIIHTFTAFTEDYSTNTNTPRVLNISQEQFYNTFYEPYLGKTGTMMVTKKNLGKDESGEYDIWSYDFMPFNAKKKILLTSGMHTYELPGAFGLARWVKEYMESDADVFAYMRENVQLSIIPIVNPWGWNQNPKKYGNVNGVNPNRNFDDWEGAWAEYPVYSPDPNDANYSEWNVKGEAAFSESETRILCNWVKNNNDADFWIDCHTGLGNSIITEGDVWYVYTSSNVNADKLTRAANAMAAHIASTYVTTPKIKAVVDAQNSIKQRYGTAVIGVPTITIEQANYDDTAYQTVPNNCPTAIKEYATQIHAFIVSQLQSHNVNSSIKELNDNIKTALLDCISHVGLWSDEHAEDYYNALHDALYPSYDVFLGKTIKSSTGDEEDNSERMCSDYIAINSANFSAEISNPNIYIGFRAYGANFNYITPAEGLGTMQTPSAYGTWSSAVKYVRMVAKKSDDSQFVQADIDGVTLTVNGDTRVIQ